jgi:hypothetical protein
LKSDSIPNLSHFLDFGPGLIEPYKIKIKFTFRNKISASNTFIVAIILSPTICFVALPETRLFFADSFLETSYLILQVLILPMEIGTGCVYSPKSTVQVPETGFCGFTGSIQVDYLFHERIDGMFPSLKRYTG